MAATIRDISPRIPATVVQATPFAPWHTFVTAGSIGDVDLEAYWGPAVVIRVPATRGKVLALGDILPQVQRFRRPRLKTGDLAGALKIPAAAGGMPWEDGSGTFRCLVSTGSSTDPNLPDIDQAALDPAVVDALVEEGCVLIGMDTASILPRGADAFGHKMANLVSLALAGVPEGWYALVALPLKLDGVTGSPVRAALKPLSR